MNLGITLGLDSTADNSYIIYVKSSTIVTLHDKESNLPLKEQGQLHIRCRHVSLINFGDSTIINHIHTRQRSKFSKL